eukprot:1345429-Rhodomonas_salina.1
MHWHWQLSPGPGPYRDPLPVISSCGRPGRSRGSEQAPAHRPPSSSHHVTHHSASRDMASQAGSPRHPPPSPAVVLCSMPHACAFTRAAACAEL